MNADAPKPAIEFWFEFASNYSYLSAMRIEAKARAHGVTVLWRPFLLGPIFQSFGWDNSPFVLQKEKGAYVWRDMERQCAKYGIPWKYPSTFPRGSILATRIALACAGEPWIGAFCRRIYALNFAEDRDIGNQAVIEEVLEAFDQPVAETIARATTDENKLRLRTQTETALERGVFGAPTFFVGDEMYWGNDRLDDALVDAQTNATIRI